MTSNPSLHRSVPRGLVPSFPTILVLVLLALASSAHARTIISTPFGTSYQVNVNSLGQNIPGDAANEPSLCLDPNNPNRIAIGWRQFNTTNSNFRQAGYGYSTNGGISWTFGGTLQTNMFRSDPVLAADAEGRFYYLSLYMPPTTFQCDIWRSTNGGASWQQLGQAAGGDKSWMTIDKTSSPAHGTIYQDWDTSSVTGTRDFSFSRDGGLTWTNPFVIPDTPYFGTLDVGPNGEVYLLGNDGSQFWLNRSTNAANPAVPFAYDLTVAVNLGGNLLADRLPNPGGLIGQAWIAVDRSTNSTRGNVYALCATGNASNQCDIMFARSTNGGANWSAPLRINTDPGTNAFHWFGALAVAPNGRVDACWYDSRNDTNNVYSQLFYCNSSDGGLTWSTNTAISPPFNPALGYPQQEKIGDYITMISLTNAACIAYSATFNGEADVYFVRIPDLPIELNIATAGTNVALSWNAVVGNMYCVQYKSSLTAPWPNGTNEICVTATNTQMTVLDTIQPANADRFYRVVTTGYGANFPTIANQPASVTNYAFTAATFTVGAYSMVPLSYQWKSNGVAIPGATQRSLTLKSLAPAYAATYSVNVSNINGNLDSTPATLAVLAAPTNPPNLTNLVMHLAFDNDLSDATGRGNSGTAIHVTTTTSNVTTATFVPGMLGSALHYSSDFGVFPCCTTTNTSYVTLGVRPDLQFSSNINFTVAYWIRLPTNYAGGDLPFFTDTINSTFGPGFVFAPTYGASGTQTTGSVNGGWALSLFDGATGVNGVGVYGNANSINDGNWHHLVHTFDRVSGMVTYLDGVAAVFSVQGGTSAADAGNVNTPNAAVIGQDPTGKYMESGSADIDDLGVWHRALSALEAASIYSAAVGNHLSFTGSP